MTPARAIKLGCRNAKNAAKSIIMPGNCLKSPVNRMGGKSFLATWIAGKIPEHVTYVEPFAGAAHLLFAKEPSPVEIINDIDSHLVNFFKVIQEPVKCQMLTKFLDYTPYSRTLWNELRTNWKQGNIPSDPVEASAQWYYLNRTCFSGDQKRGGFAVPSITGRNPVQSFRNAIEGLEDVAERLLKGWKMLQRDYGTFVLRIYPMPNVLGDMIQKIPCFIATHRTLIQNTITARIPLARLTIMSLQRYFTA